MTDRGKLGTLESDVDLRLTGKVVSRCCVDTALSLEFLEKDMQTSIRIGGQILIEQEGTRLELSGETTTEAGQASVLVGRIVRRALGQKDGTLDMGFTDGSRLMVPVDPRYEAWELSSTDGFMVVSRPGGGLAIWGPRDKLGKDGRAK